MRQIGRSNIILTILTSIGRSSWEFPVEFVSRRRRSGEKRSELVKIVGWKKKKVLEGVA